MSRKIARASASSLPFAAALLIHIGTAAAATPSGDFQRQVSAVLAGNVAHVTQANSTSDETTGTQADAQEFARQLLSGWSVSHPGRARSATELHSQAAADVTRRASPAQDDFQSMVQRFLQGEKSAARGAS